jgi:glyoxylase-like metal-dependent hydrolase (beta-lactamase superfamily II)
MKKITPRVYQLSGLWGAGVWGANVFLLVDDNLTLVDTGFKGRATQIIKEVGQLGYSPSDIANIIITHYHADHVGSLAALKKATQAKVMAHPADAPYIDGQLPQPGPTRPRWLGKTIAPLRRLWATTPAAVDILVNDGDELPILDGIKVLHAPGHTPGSISLFLEKERLVIAGDVLAHRFGLRLPSKAFTIDIAQEIHSIKRLTSLDFDIMCFGHGLPLLHEARPIVNSFVEVLERKYQKRHQSCTIHCDALTVQVFTC